MAEDKQAMREAMCAAAAIVAGALASYAHDTKNHDLKKRADFSIHLRITKATCD